MIGNLLSKGHIFKFIKKCDYNIDDIYQCEICGNKFIKGASHSLSYFIYIGKNIRTYWPDDMPSCNESIIKDIIE